MCSTRTATLLLLFAVICIPGEAVFPEMSEEVSECIERECFDKIVVCQELYGEELTGPLKAVRTSSTPKSNSSYTGLSMSGVAAITALSVRFGRSKAERYELLEILLMKITPHSYDGFTLIEVENAECCLLKVASLRLKGEPSSTDSCIAENCKGAVIRCMKGVIHIIAAARRSESPLISTEAFERLIEIVVEETIDSIFHCFTYSDLDDTDQFIDCFLEDLVNRAERYVNMLSLLTGTPETGEVWCWLKQGLKQIMSCLDHTDDDYDAVIRHNTKMEKIFNREEYINCSNRMFKDKKCFQMYARVIGSTPAMLTKSKDLYVCIINELVVATAAC